MPYVKWFFYQPRFDSYAQTRRKTRYDLDASTAFRSVKGGNLVDVEFTEDAGAEAWFDGPYLFPPLFKIASRQFLFGYAA